MGDFTIACLHQVQPENCKDVAWEWLEQFTGSEKIPRCDAKGRSKYSERYHNELGFREEVNNFSLFNLYNLKGLEDNLMMGVRQNQDFYHFWVHSFHSSHQQSRALPLSEMQFSIYLIQLLNSSPK